MLSSHSAAMSKPPEVPNEGQVRSAWEAGDFDRATALTLRLYSSEVFGFLVAVHRDRDDADDAFALLCKRLWETLARFTWSCSLRTWVYLLARHASADVRRSKQRGQGRCVALGEDGELPEQAAQVRTETQSILRTEKRTAFAELCLALPPEDRELLVLRVDRELTWRDVALVMAGPEGLTGERAIAQECARLRKRFQLVREKLRELGRERGLLH
jgi:RNA polymerase sigma-70 factor, ECF subfamily